MTHYTVITARPVMRHFAPADSITVIEEKMTEEQLGAKMAELARKENAAVRRSLAPNPAQPPKRSYRQPKAEVLVLDILRDRGEADIGDMADELGFVRQTVNVAVKRLRKLGHIINIVRTGSRSSKYVLVKEATQ